jgi:hypothetical protein
MHAPKVITCDEAAAREGSKASDLRVDLEAGDFGAGVQMIPQPDCVTTVQQEPAIRR